MIKYAAALLFISINFYTYNYMASEAVFPPREHFESFPTQFGAWTCAKQQEMTPEVERNLGVTDYLICNYVRHEQGDMVGVYVGYHESQVRDEGGGAGENSIHPPAHCLPGSGWDIIDSRTVPLDMEGLPGRPQDVNRLIIAKGEARQLVYYWYQSRGRVIAQDPMKILYVFLDRATSGRTDGSLVRFTIPIRRDNEEQADAAFRELASELLPWLPAYVPN